MSGAARDVALVLVVLAICLATAILVGPVVEAIL